MNNIKLNKKIIILIFISFFISLIFSVYFTYKYDRYESDSFTHSMVKGDAHPIWIKADILKKDLVSGKDYLLSGSELLRSYLPERIVAFFSIIFNYELFLDNSDKVRLDIKKIYYLIFKSLLYFIVIFYLIKKVQNFLDSDSTFYCGLFLCLCPSIIFFHSSFHTESIFFSLQILLLFFIMNPSSKILINIFYGLLIGFLFLQKTVALYYIFIIVFFFILNFKIKFFKPIFFLLIGYVIVLLFVGLGNFKRMGVFYIEPTQAHSAVLWYTSDHILSKGMNISIEKAKYKIKNDQDNWIKEKKLNLEKEEDRLLFGKFQKKYALDLILEYPIISSKLIIWKSIQTAMLNPFFVPHYFYWEQIKDKKYYLTKKYKKIWWPINIFYSLFLYFFIFIGFINSFRIISVKLNFLLFFSGMYMFLMLGWVGHDRYMLPSLIYFSVYFGIGVMAIKKFLRKRNLIFFLNKY